VTRRENRIGSRHWCGIAVGSAVSVRVLSVRVPRSQRYSLCFDASQTRQSFPGLVSALATEFPCKSMSEHMPYTCEGALRHLPRLDLILLDVR
jgi:hypothetical protein